MSVYRSAILARPPKHVGYALVVGESGGDEKEVGQAVHIFDRRRRDAFAWLVFELDHQAFGTPADRAREMQIGRGRASPGQDERPQRVELAVQPIDLPLE